MLQRYKKNTQKKRKADGDRRGQTQSVTPEVIKDTHTHTHIHTKRLAASAVRMRKLQKEEEEGRVSPGRWQ